ncbi:DUF1853 family protein [Paraburkholderia sp.]|uniref:DUF1853 family protein n=1 Tax=Paraburkholderia sp. TaxID=1926495 RepID=UPI00238AF0EA|nr:DUF1853 family protein [Paraburkholderia sp.]MDE1184035.1 DUF1853 family protein [Paraburkholderia sp.]
MSSPSASAPSPSPSHFALTGFLDELHDPAVRDLAWLLFSADLLHAQPPVGMLAELFETPMERVATLDWLRALDASPAALQHDIATTRLTRLGRYAEFLLGWFLEHGPAARGVAAGVPLRRAGVTLGECDFLVETQRGQRLHWELAVKCYLHAGDGRAQLADYVGPNLKDRFDLKLAHLLDHQLPLSARVEFASLGYRGPWAAQMVVKGWLFYRRRDTLDVDFENDGGEGSVTTHADAALAIPPELAAAHARGWWTTRAEWLEVAARHAPAWKVLSRLEWLAPRRYEISDGDAELAADAGCVDAGSLHARIAHQTGPTMVAAFTRDASGRFTERSRGFVVPDDWPDRAHAYAREFIAKRVAADARKP